MASLPEILDELYAADPSLRNEPSVPAIVEQLLSVRSTIRVDEAFRQRLRSQLVTNLHSPQPLTPTRTSMSLKWFIAVPVVAIAAVLILPKLRTTIPSPNQTPAVVITPTTDQAFGTLSSSLVTAESATTRQAAGSADTAVVTDPPSTMIAKPFVPTTFRYVYAGAPLVLSEASVDVLERRTGTETRATSDLLQTMGLDTVDLNSFGGLNVQSLTLSQTDGYTINIDGPSGSVALYQSAADRTPILLEDQAVASNQTIPPDNELVEIANRFLALHGIDRSGYASPSVQPATNAVPALGREPAATDLKAEELSIQYQPQSVQVIYPMTVSGLTAFGLWGDPVGMVVDIDIQNRTVMSVYNLMTRRYSSSAYPAVTDPAAILNVVERGGLYGNGLQPDATITDVKLGDPVRVMAQMYRSEGGRSRELLVPALRFPVQDRTDVMPMAIVVPLVKDLLNVDQPVIEPISIDGGGSSSSSSGTTVEPQPPVVDDSSPERN